MWEVDSLDDDEALLLGGNADGVQVLAQGEQPRLQILQQQARPPLQAARHLRNARNELSR